MPSTNPTRDASAEITIPYDPRFSRAEAHYSFLYFGASLAALAGLAGTKGYALVGGDSAGVNAFFVRRDVLGATSEVTAADAYVASRLRESRNEKGELSKLTEHADRIALIADMPVIDVRTSEQTTVGEALG